MTTDDTAPTTTHADWGEGNPRLIVSRSGERETVPLSDNVTVGSSPEATIHIAEASNVHATVIHRSDDEYVVTLHDDGGLTANPDAAASGVSGDGQVLRHGARFTVAGVDLIFQRDEFADHGRPAGGRQGGEYSDQAPQPRRPDYAHGETVADVRASGDEESADGEAENVG